MAEDTKVRLVKKDETLPDIKNVTAALVKVKMKVSSATPDGVMEAEKVYRIPKEYAEDLINGSYAELTNEPIYNG